MLGSVYCGGLPSNSYLSFFHPTWGIHTHIIRAQPGDTRVRVQIQQNIIFK